MIKGKKQEQVKQVQKTAWGICLIQKKDNFFSFDDAAFVLDDAVQPEPDDTVELADQRTGKIKKKYTLGSKLQVFFNLSIAFQFLNYFSEVNIELAIKHEIQLSKLLSFRTDLVVYFLYDFMKIHFYRI